MYLYYYIYITNLYLTILRIQSIRLITCCVIYDEFKETYKYEKYSIIRHYNIIISQSIK